MNTTCTIIKLWNILLDNKINKTELIFNVNLHQNVRPNWIKIMWLCDSRETTRRSLWNISLRTSQLQHLARLQIIYMSSVQPLILTLLVGVISFSMIANHKQTCIIHFFIVGRIYIRILPTPRINMLFLKEKYFFIVSFIAEFESWKFEIWKFVKDGEGFIGVAMFLHVVAPALPELLRLSTRSCPYIDIPFSTWVIIQHSRDDFFDIWTNLNLHT